MLTTLSDATIQSCPATGEAAQWRQVNTSKAKHPAKV
jgi:hypothetical protein